MDCISTISCSKHGCLDPLSLVCMCDPGYTGIGDYSFNGIHCDINEASIEALNIINICVASICNLLIIMYIINECRRKGKLSFLSFHPKALFPLFFLLYGIGIIIFNSMKLVSKGKHTIGNNMEITIVASLLHVVLFSGLIIYFRLIISFLNGYAHMMSSSHSEKVRIRIGTLKFFSWFISPIQLAICLVQIVGLLYPEHEEQIGMFYNIATGINNFCFGFIFNHAVGFLLRELVIHIKNAPEGSSADIKAVFKRLKLAYLVVWVVFLSTMIFMIIFGSSTYLLRRSSYLVLILQIMMPPTLIVFILTVTRITRGNRKFFTFIVSVSNSKSKSRAISDKNNEEKSRAFSEKNNVPSQINRSQINRSMGSIVGVNVEPL